MLCMQLNSKPAGTQGVGWGSPEEPVRRATKVDLLSYAFACVGRKRICPCCAHSACLVGAGRPRGRAPPILSPRITHMTRRPRRRRGRADRNFDSRTNGRWPGQAARPATAARPGGVPAACWRRGRKRRPYGQNQLLTAQLPAVPFWGGARHRSPFICVSFQVLTQSPTDTPFLFVNVCVQQGRICTHRGPHVRKASVSPILYYSRSIFLLRANLRIRPCCSHTL